MWYFYFSTQPINPVLSLLSDLSSLDFKQPCTTMVDSSSIQYICQQRNKRWFLTTRPIYILDCTRVNRDKLGPRILTCISCISSSNKAHWIALPICSLSWHERISWDHFPGCSQLQLCSQRRGFYNSQFPSFFPSLRGHDVVWHLEDEESFHRFTIAL